MTDATIVRPVDDPQHTAVVGGGLAGLLAALMLLHDGYRVTVLERDDTNVPTTADEAFDHWDRLGAAHARQSDAILAGLRRILANWCPMFSTRSLLKVPPS